MPRMIIPVDLFGLPADHAAINALAAAEKLFVLDDAAQGFGGDHRQPQDRHAARCDRHQLLSGEAARLLWRRRRGLHRRRRARATSSLSLRVHGQGTDKYDNVRIGLDRAARYHPGRGADREARRSFPTRSRRATASRERYSQALDGIVTVPAVPTALDLGLGAIHDPHAAGTRETFAAALKADGIPTAIYYPKPLHRQKAYQGFPCADGGLPVSDLLADEVISLPMHAYLDEPTQDRIIAAVARAVGG